MTCHIALAGQHSGSPSIKGAKQVGIFRDQTGKEVISKGEGLPPVGSTVTIPDGTGRIGNGTWGGGIANPNPPPKSTS
jgi:hypothetical protein